MSCWLYQNGDSVAHAYPDDDSITIAACGHRLREYCDSCGRDEDVGDGEKQRKCPQCDAAKPKGEGEAK